MASITNIDKMNKTKTSNDKEGSTLSNKNIVFDTKGLTKQDIEKLEPFITDIKVTTEETIDLKKDE